MPQHDFGTMVSSNRQTLVIPSVWHLHFQQENEDQEVQVSSARRLGMATITGLECSGCKSIGTWNNNVGVIFAQFIFYNTQSNTDNHARLLFRLLLSESTSIVSESLSRFSPIETLSGTKGGLTQAFILESSPPVNRMLFYIA